MIRSGRLWTRCTKGAPAPEWLSPSIPRAHIGPAAGGGALDVVEAIELRLGLARELRRSGTSPTRPAVRNVERGQHLPTAGLGDRTHLGVAHDEEVPGLDPGDRDPPDLVRIHPRLEEGPIRESAKTSDEQEARRLLHARLAEATPLRVERLAQGEVTVGKLLDLVRDDYADQGRTLPPGILDAWHAARGARRAIDVRRDHLDAIARRWRTTGPEWPGRKRVRPLDRSTVNRYMALLRRAYRLGREKLELETPLTFPCYKETNVGRAIPAPILKSLLDSETLTRRWPARGTFFRFAYLSGVRRGQLLATRLAQFQPETGTMTWRPEQTKTEDAHNVTYASEALDLLRWFWEQRNLACPAFFQEDGTALTPDKLNAAWWAACREVGLPVGRKSGGYVIHELRHTMVSEWIHAGEPEKAIMSLTGHKAVATLHRYGHTSAEAQRAAQERVTTWRARQPVTVPKVVNLQHVG